MHVVTSDIEIALAQLESWIENKASVGLIFENGFAVGLNESGTLEHFETFFVFKNSLVMIHFDPRNAFPEVRFEDGVYQVRLRYDCGLLTICERKTRELPEEI